MSAQVALKTKVGFRRTESEPANTTVNDIRCKFESTSDGYSSLDVGLSFGAKKSTPCSTPSSEAPSPVVLRKHVADPIIDSKCLPSSSKTQLKQKIDAKPESFAPKTTKISVNYETPIDKYKKAIVKPDSLIIPNGTTSKHSIDKHTLIGFHNTGIVSSRKQQIVSPILSPTVAVPSLRPSSKEKSKTESGVKNSILQVEQSKKKAATPIGDKIAASRNDKRTSTPVSDRSVKDTSYRYSLPEDVTSRSQQSKQPAKAFWKSISVDSDSSNLDSPARVDSIFEPGMDYAKLKKPSNSKDKSTGSLVDKGKVSPKVTPKAVQLTASNLKKVSESLSDFKTTQRISTQSEDSKSTLNSLSKSPSISSTCSSMDSLDIEYINGPFSYKMRRRDTKPPQNIVARRTQMFEKSMDEINAVLEEAEAYNKVKESGFGTVFTTVQTSATQSKPRSTSQSKPSDEKTKNGLLNNNSKIANKNIFNTKTTGSKPLPALPISAKCSDSDSDSNSLKPPPPQRALKSKVTGPPPKPPRTFEHAKLSPASSTEMVFDPVAIPRQAGDGEENHGYESHVPYESSHVYTSVTAPADTRPYTTTTSIDTRPYTSLTTTGGSGGDDSVAGSENAYDTLGRASVASSYEHYDTISQSELDSDISRPPTLPRRPSNLRHPRPLTTAFSHMDISKNAAFHNQLNKALSSNSQTIKETSPTSPSPTKMRVPFKLKYLLPKIRRKADEMRKASSMADLLDDKEGVYDSVDIRPVTAAENSWQASNPPEVPIDEAGYALPDIKVLHYMFFK